jgi:hypothetical protein
VDILDLDGKKTGYYGVFLIPITAHPVLTFAASYQLGNQENP